MEFRKIVTITLSAGLEETQETIQAKVVANYTHTHTHARMHATYSSFPRVISLMLIYIFLFITYNPTLKIN